MTKEQFKTIPLADIKPGLRWYNEKHKTMYRIEKICYWESYDDTSIPFDNYQKAIDHFGKDRIAPNGPYEIWIQIEKMGPNDYTWKHYCTNTEYLYLFENHFDFDGYGKDTVKFM